MLQAVPPGVDPSAGIANARKVKGVVRGGVLRTGDDLRQLVWR